MTAAIRIAVSDSDVVATYDVMRQLYSRIEHIDRAEYLRLVREQQELVRYQLAFLQDDGKILTVAGFHVCRSLGWGKYLYVDDLVTDTRGRSALAGKVMFAWLREYADDEGCDEIRLDSAVSRHDAHRFYLRERMDIAGFSFRLPLKDPRSTDSVES